MKNEKMNSYAKELVTENHKLIFSFMNTRHLSENDVEDWYGVAALAMCKAAMTYDPNRGVRFSTYAYFCMENAVRHVKAKNRRHDLDTVSYDQMIDGTDVEFLSIFADEKNTMVQHVELEDSITRVLRKYDGRDVKILHEIVDCGRTMEEVAEEFNLSRQRISLIYRKFIKEVRDEYLLEAHERPAESKRGRKKVNA